jgi:hypothetical protein
MVRLALLALLLTTVCGCSSNNKGQLEGTRWLSDEQTIKGTTMAKGAVALEFKPDYTLTLTVGGTDRYTGKYSLEFGDYVTFKFDREYRTTGKRVHSERILVSGNKLTMTDDDGTAVSYTRWDPTLRN